MGTTPETADTAEGTPKNRSWLLYSEVKVVQYGAGRECHSHACYVNPAADHARFFHVKPHFSVRAEKRFPPLDFTIRPAGIPAFRSAQPDSPPLEGGECVGTKRSSQRHPLA